MTGGEKRSASSDALVDEAAGDGSHVEKKPRHDVPDEAAGEHESDKNQGESKGKHHIRVTVPVADSVRTQVTSEAIHGIDENALRATIEKIYGLKMPQDFFDFWDFCTRVNPMNPEMALSALNLELIGPFDFLSQDIPSFGRDEDELQKLALTHWRFFYDVPEVQTCLRVNGDSQLHYGYFRRSPTDLPEFLVKNDAAAGGKFEMAGINIFAVVLHVAHEQLGNADDKSKAELKDLVEMIKSHAEKFGHSLDEPNVHTRHADQSTTGSSIIGPHGLPIVGVEDDDTLENRHRISTAGIEHLLKDHESEAKELHAEADAKLKDLETKLHNDVKDGHIGAALEYATILFCSGYRGLTKRAARFFVEAYKHAGKDKFAEIAEAHSHHRVHVLNLSSLRAESK